MAVQSVAMGGESEGETYYQLSGTKRGRTEPGGETGGRRRGRGRF